LGFLQPLFSSDFMPHGYCYLWNPRIVWLHVVSDALITISYYCIPVALIYFARRRRDIPFGWMFWMFGAFILGCGTTHLMEIWTVWHPTYLLAGVVKALTAGVSVLTAVMLVPLIPRMENRIEQRTGALQAEIDERRRAEDALRESEKRLAGIIDSAMDAIITVDGEQRVVLFNAAAERMFGCSSQEAMGQAIDRFIPQRFHAQHSGHIRQFSSTGVTGRAMGALGSLWGLRAGGEEFPIEASISQMEAGGKKLFTVIIRDITERQRADANRGRLAAIIESTDSAILSKDLSGVITSWNKAAERLYGYLEAEAVGKPIDLVIPPELRIEEQRILRQVAGAGMVVHNETVRQRKDGTLVSVALIVSPMRDASGKVVAISSIAQDITERKRAEAALHQQAQVLDLAQVMARDMDGRIVVWTHGCEQLYGYSRDEAVGRASHQLLHTIFPQPLSEIEAEILNRGRWEGELIHCKKDGGQVAVASVWVLSRDEQGRPIRIIEANTDISERKQAREKLALQADELARQAAELTRSRQALEAQSLMLRSVLDSMAEGLVAADENGKFVIWNAAAEKILGLGAANVPSAEWSEHYGLYLPDTVTPFPADKLPLVLAIQGVASTADMFVRNPELEQGVWIEISGRSLRDANGVQHGGVVAFRDVTQKKAAEQEIRKLNEELEQRVVERTAQLEAANQELEAFTYSVSHDLRAPLRHIAGFAGILMEEFGPKLEPQAQHYLQRITEGTRKMGVLVDELLTLARVGRQTPSLQVAGLSSIVTEVVALLKPDYEGRRVEWKIAPLPFVECDPTLLKQVFQNLISNALKYSRPRAEAIIEIGQTEVEGGKSAIFVRDNGVGFSMKYADKLFGVFQRLHRAEDFEGTGVGLATVQRIVQKHGGRVWAQAELDRGATFYFTLPGAERKEGREAAGAALGAQA